MTRPNAAPKTEEPTIDSCVLDNADCLADTWLNSQGKRLYRLSGPIGDHPPVYALTKYKREIDDETGEAVESEYIEGLGEITPNLYFRNAERQICDVLMEENEPDHEFWNEASVELILGEFETYLQERLLALLENTPEAVTDIHLGKEIRIAIDTDTEAQRLAQVSSSFSEVEFGSLLYAVESESTYIDNTRLNDDIDADKVYAFQPEFETIPDWRLRAIENHLCGVFQNAPALANVAALLESDAVNTQAEIAETLGKDESTISQQVSDVEDWRERAEWMCENRL